MVAGDNGCGVASAVVSPPRSNVGLGIVPAATVEVTSAMPNGDATTLPWPNPSSARSMVPDAGGTEPVTVVTPGTTKSTPSPSRLAASVSALPSMSTASAANVVLHE